MRFRNQSLLQSADNFNQFLRWLLLSTLVGLTVGLISILFNFGMKNAIQLRHPADVRH